MSSPVGLWTSPADRREPCGPCGQPLDNARALPTACPHSRASRPQSHRTDCKLFQRTTGQSHLLLRQRGVFARRGRVDRSKGWNVGELDQMALPPCHKTYQVFVSEQGRLSLALCQRSADSCAGLPWNVCSAALLARLLAKETGLEPGEIVWFGMDVHLYLNHIEQAREQIARKPRPFPALTIKRRAGSLFDYRIDDFELKGYDPHPPISLPIAV